MNIEELKEKARRHELKEEWQKAFDLYSTALRMHDEDEPPDITLYNRVGDIQTRLGQIDGATEQYEKAIDLYLEAELPNNAIAICKKVLRNLPERTAFFLRMGQIRASQGFLTDARQNFLTYAERKTALGDIESALNALVEFVEISPEDLEIRRSLADQLEAHERTEEAVEQYQEVYRRLMLAGEEEEAREVEETLQALAPDQPLPDLDPSEAEATGMDDGEMVLESTSLGGLEFEDWDDADSPSEAVEVDLGSVGDEAPWDQGEDHEDVEPVEVEEVQEAVAGAEEEEDREGELSFAGMELGEMESLETNDSAPAGGEDEDESLAGLPSFDFQDEAEDTEILPAFDFPEEDLGEAELGEVELGEVELGELETGGPGLDEEDSEAEPLPFIGFDEDEDEGAGGEAEEDRADDAADPVVSTEQDLPLLSMDEEEEPETRAEPEPEAKLELEGELALDEESGEELEEQEPALVEESGPEEEPAPALEGAVEEASFESGIVSREDAEPPAPEARAPAAGEVPGPLEPAVEAPSEGEDHLAAAAVGDMDLAMERVRGLIESAPDDVELHQRLVEYAFRKNDQDTLIQAYLELAGCLARTDSPMKANAVYQQVLALSPGHPGATAGIQELQGTAPSEDRSPVASSEEYVDLGSLILGDDAEKTTRWKVAADTPSGDEEADFAKMLGQFKDKVSEHVAADDVTAHHDLGTAYMEMGLFDEAIGEFQMALRASPTHLPTHEVMGRCWMEMGKPDMAVRALERALRVPWEVEDELIGIYYLMGRAQEERGKRDDAVEFYEKVFSLDINFEDVTERLRALR